MLASNDGVLNFLDTKAENFFREVASDWADYPRGVTQRETVWQAGNVSLLQFSTEEDVTGTPVLIIPSLINRWYIMDVTEKTSYIKRLSENRPTFLIDWGYPGEEVGHMPLSHYYHRSIKRAVRQVKKITGDEKVDMLGYCIGGTMAYAYSCLEPETVDHLVLLTSPLDFDEAGILADYAKTFPAEEFLESMSTMPGWMLAFSFNFIQPMGTYGKAKMFHRKCENKNFLELYNAMERWVADPVDFPIRSYYELLTDLYKENLLAKGKLKTSDGRVVDPALRKAKILVLNAEKDHIAPLPTTNLPEFDNGFVRHVTIPAGHIGITTGRHGQTACSALIDFINDQEKERYV